MSAAPLSEYVIPILNYPNMEGVLSYMGYDIECIDKSEYYKNLARSLKRRDDIIGFYDRLRSCPYTNMERVLFHLLRNHPDFQDVLTAPDIKDWKFIRSRLCPISIILGSSPHLIRTPSGNEGVEGGRTPLWGLLL